MLGVLIPYSLCFYGIDTGRSELNFSGCELVHLYVLIPHDEAHHLLAILLHKNKCSCSLTTIITLDYQNFHPYQYLEPQPNQDFILLHFLNMTEKIKNSGHAMILLIMKYRDFLILLYPLHPPSSMTMRQSPHLVVWSRNIWYS